jgi:hypothetical protein
MTEFAKMDIFFLVSTIAVIVLAALVSFAVWRILRILRNVEKISEIVTEEGQLVRADIANLRSSVRSEGLKWMHLSKFFSVFSTRLRKRTRKKE